MSEKPFKVYGEHDKKTLVQMQKCMDAGSAVSGVLCADGHLGYNHPIGGVVGYSDHISISGVGFDIGCGNLATKLDVKFSEIEHNVSNIMRDIQNRIKFGVGVKNEYAPDDPLFHYDYLWKDAGAEELKDKARSQLGTCGSGNHYVDLLEDEDGYVWIGVHFGSRGLGHSITTKYLKAVGGKDEMEGYPVLLEVDSDIGRSYKAGLELAGMYATSGREWVVEEVRKIIGGNMIDTVHNHHNWMWEEMHDGQKLYVVRKGATPAWPEQRGFVGGSMGDNAVILSGIQSEESEESLYSTVHGAGRVMSRTKAKGKVHRKTGVRKTEPAITKRDMKDWIDDRGVTLIGGGVDEAPQAYRRLDEVLDYHKNTIQIEHTLRPFAVYMDK